VLVTGGAQQLRRFLLDLAAAALILLAPFAILLSYHGYSFFTPEVLLIFALAVVAAALLALVLRVSGGLVRAVLLAAVLVLFIDIQVDVPPWSSVTITLLFLVGIGVLAGILWLLREHATAILCVIFVTLLALTLVRGHPESDRIVSVQGAAAGSSETAPPLLIHLLLDEHIGIEGLPPEVPAAQVLRAELIHFYTTRGFRLFGGAYSQYANTYNSIANLLNFAAREVSHPYLLHGSDEAEWDLKQAAYFQMLQQRGYRLHVYQSSYMDLCHVEGIRLQECTTYPVASVGMLQSLNLPAWEKTRAIANAIVTQSAVLRVLNKVYERGLRVALLKVGLSAPAWRWQPPSFGPLRVPAVFERLSEDVLRNPRGHAFFAHLILPHYPYVFDSGCELRPRTSDWLTNRIASADELLYNTADSRAQKYERYVEQIRCVVSMLDGLFTKLEARGLLADATIIVNGDHGSRIPLYFPSGATLARGVLSDADYSDAFSTLYAIKQPGVSPGYDPAAASLVELLNHHLIGEPLREQNSCRVFLLEEDGEKALTAVEPEFCAP
jgi:hypothetical protein